MSPETSARNAGAKSTELFRNAIAVVSVFAIVAAGINYGGDIALYGRVVEDLLEALALFTLVFVGVWGVREQLRIPAVRHTVVLVAIMALLSQTLDITEEIRRLDKVFILGEDGTLHTIVRNLSVYGVAVSLVIALVFSISALEEERRRAARSEQQYRLLAEHVSDVIWTMDLTFRRTYVSPSIARLRGYTVEEAMAQPLEDVLAKTSFDVARGMLETVATDRSPGIQDDDTRNVELEMNRKDGSTVWTEVSVSVLYDADRKPEGLIGVTRDISKRKQAEEALRTSEEGYRALVDQASDGIFVSDVYGVVLDVNSSGCRMVGHTRDEILGRRMEDFMPEGELENNPVHWDELKEGKRLLAERHLLCKDGAVVPVEIATRLLSDGRIQGIVRDVSDRVRAAEERVKLEEELRQAQRMESIGRLAGGVAHDLNNLLSPVIGYAELALAQLPETDPIRPYLVDIHDGGERAKDLARQLLAFSRKQMLAMQVLNLSELVHDFENMIRRLVEEKVEVEVQLEPALGSVRADPSQIRQVLMNLALNARDAMPAGGRITILTANTFLDEEGVRAYGDIEPGPYAMLMVRDSGCGMDGEVRRHIYEPFFSTKEPGRGTGLGLATVYGIVKQHGGAISVDTEPGRGTTFRVYLPRVEASAEKSRWRPTVEIAGHGNETVLVVEDDGRVRKLACQILRKRGYDVREAKDAEEALRISTRYDGPIQLLLTDIVMPHMNGRELYERLSYYRPDTKVLYMSGHSDDVIAHHGVLDPGVHFLQKPFSVPELMRKVRDVLDS